MRSTKSPYPLISLSPHFTLQRRRANVCCSNHDTWKQDRRSACQPVGTCGRRFGCTVKIADGVAATEAWTEAAMFRGFEIIFPKGKDPQGWV